jgi:uncharacterized protein (AIM24 family)
MNKGSGQAPRGLRRPYPGKIVAVHLAEIGGELIATEWTRFLVSTKASAIGIRVSNGASGTGLFEAARASSCNACRATGGPSSTGAARSTESLPRGR